MQDDDLSKIDLWIKQATKEIILSEPGTDRSQFPLRDLLSSLADKSKDLADLEEFHKCATFSNTAIEEMLFSGEPYSEAQLELLNNLATQLGQLRDNPLEVFVEPALPAAAAGGSAEVTPEPVTQQAIPQASAELDEFTSINLEGDGEILHEFANEAREHLENIEQGILVLEDNPQDATTLSSIFRAFHTFKGASGFLRLQPVNRLSHELENLLDLARSGRLELTPPIIDIILEGKDVLKIFTDELQLQLDLKKPVEPIHVPVNDLTARVKAVIANPHAAVVARPTGNGDATEPGAAPAEPTRKAPAATASKSVSQMMKVDTRKFDSLVELVGELVIAQSQVSQHPDLVGLRSQQLARNLLQLSQTALALQKIAMSLRMVAIKGTFQKMNRLVRDLTANIGKDVELVIRGEDTEMDRTMVEELADPLMHMIRNSVDHGIEAPAARLAAGKSAKGTIRLSAFHQGGSMVIEIADDGAGLNKSRILAKAIERGIVSPGAELDDRQIHELIFAPGFSTAEKITDISGRGVGMDVVKQNIAKLRGKIEIDSTLGAGTTFRIFLPLTLAIIDGLIARVGDQRYIFPTLSVCESFRPTPEMISTIYGKGEVVKVRGKLRPMLRLYEYFKITPRTTNPCEALVIVVESANQQRCILVDELIGKQEVVIKSLDERFKQNKALAGAAILGDGKVGLILDPRALVNATPTLESRHTGETDQAGEADPATMAAALTM
jgi:two-component system chemotaxis sensor kinase CheA